MNSEGEQKPMKVVGRRTATPDGLTVRGDSKEDMIAWRKHFGGLGFPKGVYRFKTHEEADAWLMKMLARPRPDPVSCPPRKN